MTKTTGQLPEIKFNKSSDNIREKTLICIARENVSISNLRVILKILDRINRIDRIRNNIEIL
jgi:GTP-sensing pleiotropic transcriptional regulator CodY